MKAVWKLNQFKGNIKFEFYLSSNATKSGVEKDTSNTQDTSAFAKKVDLAS